MRRRLTRIILFAAFILVSFNVIAATEAPKQDLLDPTFIFRGILSLVLAGLAWYANKMTAKVEELERKLNELSGCNNRLNSLELRCTALSQEDAQLQTQINMLREQVLREYHTKAEVREHQQNLEKLLSDLKGEVRSVCVRVETLQDKLYEGFNRRQQ